MTFVINPNSISQQQVELDLDSFLASSPDSAVWKDFFATSTGTLVKKLIAGFSTYLSYHTITARRESFISYAQSRSSLLAGANRLGYSAFRGRNPILDLTIVPSETTTYPKWTVIGTMKNYDLILTDTLVTTAGVGVNIQGIIGIIESSSQTAENDDLAAFVFKDQPVSADVRVFIDAVEIGTSERLLDLTTGDVAIQSNVFGSVDVLGLNLEGFPVRYFGGSTIELRYIELANPEFTTADVQLDIGVITAISINSAYQEPESSASIRVNAPLFSETQFVVRGREDYLKIFRLADTTIVSTSGEDVSAAVVRTYYVRTDKSLFDQTRKTQLQAILDSSRPFGVSPTIIADPTPVFLSLLVTSTLSGTGNIAADVRTIISAEELVLEKSLDFESLEENTEALSYVKVARYNFNPSTWSGQTTYRRGGTVVPTSPSALQASRVYQAYAKVYRSGSTEPVWPTVLGDSVVDGDVIKIGGVAACVEHNGAKFCAGATGKSGNTIMLTFAGGETNKEAVDAWNDANPLNSIVLEGDLNATNSAGTLRLGSNAGDPGSSTSYAGGTFGTGAIKGEEPSGDVPGIGGVGTYIKWCVETLEGVVPDWQPNVRYKLGDVVRPTLSARTANPDLENLMFKVCGFFDSTNKDTPSTTAGFLHDGVSFFACSTGSAGNAIELVFDGIATVSDIVSAWNAANPDNTVCFLPESAGTNVLTAATKVATGGQGTKADATDSGITFYPHQFGVDGNRINLTADGATSAGALVNLWNAANPGNQLFLTPSSLSATIIPAGNVVLAGGTSVVIREPAWPVGDIICP